MSKLADYVDFNDEKLARKYQSEPIPMSVFYEAYLDGDIDIRGDIFELLRQRDAFMKFTITRQNLQWAVTNFVPDVVQHSKSQDERMIREVYDRGNDFFEWFLGESMVYTTGRFQAADYNLEQAQRSQLKYVSEQLQLLPGERVLDIGCGWGAFVRYCADQYQADATGVTLAEKQTAYANQQIENEALRERARVLRKDYRDLETSTKYNKVVCMEMIAHVGLKNLGAFCDKTYELLEDDGLFFLQWTGMRRGVKSEDLIWGLFLSKYIFPGADAALPASAMLKAMEKAGFEVRSLTNISGHYARTLRAWFDNWQRNKEAVLAAYGERWYRIWNFFLAWSVLVAREGNVSCYQAVLHKNIRQFDRDRWIESRAPNASGNGLARNDANGAPQAQVSGK
jgi:sphingolipid C9-methyltransferase